MDEDRGIARRHRVYKRLLFSTGMYKSEGSEEDFAYLKNYGRRLSEDLENTFDCQVHIHKGSAFVMAGEDCRMGAVFPGNNVVSDIVLLTLGEIRMQIEQGIWQTGSDEICMVNRLDFEELIRNVRRKYGSGFSKNYREMPEGEFIKTIVEMMELWMFVKTDEKEHQVKIYPAAGKMQGCYPKDYAGGSKDE